jgi:serine/threonine-protein kinase
VYVEDRFCGVCGKPQTLSSGGEGSPASISTERAAARLLADLRSLTAGEYEIRGEIGRGGMAVVYLAYDLRLNRKVAIKVMLPDLAFHTGMEERFKREARTAARLDHPNIVVIHSVRDSGDPLFFVMKYVDGAPLDVVIRNHAPLPITVVQGILLQLCAALQHAHDDGVVHRDVKPANILIDTRGNVQVTDFGIAKAADSGHLTRTGLSIGTPTYMCPEQCLGHPQTPASDQYSVGIVAYEILTGHPPFQGSGIVAQWAHLQDVPAPLSEVRPDCPPSLASAVMRMLSKDPAERWASLREAAVLIGRGLPPEADAGRPILAQLVRSSPSDRPAYAVTPRSPIPRVEPAPAPVVAAPPPVAPVASVAPRKAASLDIGARQRTIETGTTERLGCRVLDAQGNEVGGEPDWSSSDPVIASVDDAGVVTAHKTGSVTIAAMLDALAAMVTVEVVPAVTRVVPAPAPVRPIDPPAVDPRPARSTLGIVPLDPTGIVGEEFLLGAKVASADGHAVETSAVTWRSLTPRIATVDSSGLVRPRRVGTATIVALSGELETRVEIPITAASRRIPLGAALGAAVGLAIVAGIVFIARAPNERRVAASDTATGTVAAAPATTTTAPAAPTTTRAGRAPIPTASTDTVIVALTPADPSALAIEVGETRSLIVQALNKAGELVPAARVEWELSNPAVATVDSDGVVTATAAGQTTITARIGRLTRVVPIAVRDATGYRMRIALARDSLAVGDSATLSVHAFDRRDRAVKVSVAWRSSNANVAAVDDRGVIRAESVGRATIVASAGSLGDTVTVVVLPVVTAADDSTVDSVRVAPSSVRQMVAPPRAASSTVAPREVSALPAGARAPSETELRSVTDSVISMIDRRIVRLAQLTRGAGEAGAQFQRFLDDNSPSSRLGGAPVVSDVRATSARVSFSVVLEWEAPAKRERTVNLETVLEAVRGGWSIREIRFPTGFAP